VSNEDFVSRPISTPQDALLYCDCLARFGSGDSVVQWAGISAVIRDLMHRLESQAAALERDEARREAAS
jgi:hypothetical protein